MHFTYLIIGSSAAAVAAVRAIRRHDKNSSLGMITKGPAESYNTCLAADVVRGTSALEDTLFYSAQHARADGVTLISHTTVQMVDARNRVVVDSNGVTYHYEKAALLALGTQPCIPAALQSYRDLGGFFSYHTMADAERIHAFFDIKKESSAVIIGGGLNGLELACALRSRGLRVTVIEKNRIIPEWPWGASRWLLKRLQEQGIVVHEQREVLEVVHEQKNIRGVLCSSGEIILADSIICATGVVSAGTILAFAVQPSMDRLGIVVNTQMHTSLPGLFAAGDCAVVQTGDTQWGSRRWAEAIQQGTVAGLNMVGHPRAIVCAPQVTVTTLGDYTWYGRREGSGNANWREIEECDTLTYEYRAYDGHGTMKNYLIAGDQNFVHKRRMQLNAGG